MSLSVNSAAERHHSLVFYNNLLSFGSWYRETLAVLSLFGFLNKKTPALYS